MTVILAILLVVLLTLILLVNKAAAGSVEQLRYPDNTLEQVHYIEDADFQAACQELNVWAEAKGFFLDCYFLSHTQQKGQPIKCAAWWSLNEKTWLLLYFTQGKADTDFVTKYSHTLGVTTCSTKDALTLPNIPNAYTQCFTQLPVQELYKRHLLACSELEQQQSIVPIAKQDLFEEIKASMLRQVDYVTQLPMWRHRGAYWYFIRRNLKVNRPISKFTA